MPDDQRAHDLPYDAGTMGEQGSVDEHGRSEARTGLDEAGTVLGFLDFLRGTVEWKTRGLTADQMAQTRPPSTMTLGGMLGHLAFVEDYWISYCLGGTWTENVGTDEQWAADPDHDWRTGEGAEPEDVRGRWLGAVARSRAVTGRLLSDGAAAGDPLGATVVRDVDREDPPATARWVLVHLVEEYGRHAGHVDLLRESVDGLVGE